MNKTGNKIIHSVWIAFVLFGVLSCARHDSSLLLNQKLYHQVTTIGQVKHGIESGLIALKSARLATSESARTAYYESAVMNFLEALAHQALIEDENKRLLMLAHLQKAARQTKDKMLLRLVLIDENPNAGDDLPGGDESERMKQSALANEAGKSELMLWDEVALRKIEPRAKALDAYLTDKAKIAHLAEGYQAGLPYYANIEAALAAYNLWPQLKYLPVLLSGFERNHQNSDGKGGLWQLTKEEIKKYSLGEDAYFDYRFDPIQSTKIAVRILAKLKKKVLEHPLTKETDDPLALVLAAYHCGFDCMLEAVDSGQTNDLWALGEPHPKAIFFQKIPQETLAFVAQFQASAHIFYNRKKFQAFEEALSSAKAAQKSPPIESIDVIGAYDLRLLARMAKIPEKALLEQNPLYKNGLTPEGQAAKLFAKRADMKDIMAVLVQWRSLKESQENIEATKKQETLISAGENKTEPPRAKGSVVEQAANVKCTAKKAPIACAEATKEKSEKSELLQPWAETNAQSPIVSATDTGDKKKATKAKTLLTYVVKSGDYLGKIARKFNVSVKSLKAHNPKLAARKNGVVKLGERLFVPQERSIEEKPEKKRAAQPKRGLSFSKRSPLETRKKTQATLNEQTPQTKRNQAPKKASGTTMAANYRFHTVANGEALSKIAERYETSIAAIKALNPKLEKRKTLWVMIGEKLRIPKKKDDETQKPSRPQARVF